MQNTSHFNINLDLLKEKDMGESSKILQVSKSIKDWEDLIAAGPINHFGSSIKTTLCGVVSNSKDAKR